MDDIQRILKLSGVLTENKIDDAVRLVSINPLNYSDLNPILRNSERIFSFAVKSAIREIYNNPTIYYALDEELQDDVDVAVALINKDPLEYSNLSKHLQKNITIGLAAVKNFFLYYFLDPELQKEPLIKKEAIDDAYVALTQLIENDCEIKETSDDYAYNVYFYAQSLFFDEKLKQLADKMLAKWVSNVPIRYMSLDYNVQKNPKIAAAAIRKNCDLINVAPPEIQNNPLIQEIASIIEF